MEEMDGLSSYSIDWYTNEKGLGIDEEAYNEEEVSGQKGGLLMYR